MRTDRLIQLLEEHVIRWDSSCAPRIPPDIIEAIDELYDTGFEDGRAAEAEAQASNNDPDY